MLLFSDPCTYKAARGSSLAALYDECRARAATCHQKTPLCSLTATSASDLLDMSNLPAVLVFREIVHVHQSHARYFASMRSRAECQTIGDRILCPGTQVPQQTRRCGSSPVSWCGTACSAEIPSTCGAVYPVGRGLMGYPDGNYARTLSLPYGASPLQQLAAQSAPCLSLGPAQPCPNG